MDNSKESIKSLANFLFDSNFKSNKTIGYEEYWNKFGKTITKRNLILELSDKILNCKIKIIEDPNLNYLIQPEIMRLESLIEEINSI